VTDSRAALILRVAARFQRQAASIRQETKKLVTPINKPKGISPSTVKEQARTEKGDAPPKRTDLRPKDVFSPKPKNMNVLDYARSGWPGEAHDYDDMQKALETQIPKDKGHATVDNLSQYLLQTGGGGGTKPVGKG